MPNDIRKLRRLMSAANHLRKQNPVILRGCPITPSQALKYAWWFEAFRKKLSTGVWRFSYYKKEGSIREAVGTLDMSRIPEDKRPKGDMSDGAAREPSVNTFPYYDLYADGDCGGWRSFRLDNFIGFIEEVK